MRALCIAGLPPPGLCEIPEICPKRHVEKICLNLSTDCGRATLSHLPARTGRRFNPSNIGLPMNKILAALIATVFAAGVFAADKPAAAASAAAKADKPAAAAAAKAPAKAAADKPAAAASAAKK